MFESEKNKNDFQLVSTSKMNQEKNITIFDTKVKGPGCDRNIRAEPEGAKAFNILEQRLPDQYHISDLCKC